MLLTFAAADSASAGTPSALLGDNVDEWSDDEDEESEVGGGDHRASPCLSPVSLASCELTLCAGPSKRLLPAERTPDLFGRAVVNIRLRAVWQEVVRGGRVPTDAVRMEEGRVESGPPG